MSRREKREREEQEEKERKKQEKQNKKKSKTKNKIDKNKKQKEKNKKERTFKKIIKTILKLILVLLLLIILSAGIFIGWLGFKYNWNWNTMLKKGAKQVALIATGQTEEDIQNLEPIYCLILGISTSEYENAKVTDTIIIGAYYPRTQQASMISIPRDTFVGKSKATANGNHKINAVYANRGIEGLLTEVNKLTGLDIKNYVIIKNKGLIQFVDALGGIEFDVPKDMNYDDWEQNLHIHLSKGKQKLNGQQAEQLVRYRHDNDGSSYSSEYGDNDIGRMRTQREFITQIAKQTLKIGNITKINDLIKIAFDNIETNLDMDYVMKYSPAAIEFDMSALQATYLPGTTPPPFGSPIPLYFFEVNKAELKKIIQEYFIFKQQKYDTGSEETSLAPSNIKIQLLNASGDEEVFKNTKKRLEEKGYKIESTGTTTIAKTTKVINRTEKKIDVVDELIDTLGYGDESIGEDLSKYDFTIAVGQDMKQYIAQN